MSDDVTIRVEELGKKYQIRHQAERQRYTALREVIADAAKKPLRWLAARRQKGPLSSDPVVSGQLSGSSAASGQLSRSPVVSGPRTEDFWDLRDVSFSVRQGEVVGIIGRNGAGKSTLLKILSRITEPTTGRVHLKGRVASLLEVGTGFHPDLTGRKNIFLNGAVLGMHRAEIKRKFDEIVAFAVVAHLEPEVLIVDEVLAVGDAQFQKKCLGKMQEVSRGGRTVLIIRNNMRVIGLTRERYLDLTARTWIWPLTSDFSFSWPVKSSLTSLGTVSAFFFVSLPAFHL